MKQMKLHVTHSNDLRFPFVLNIILFWFSVSSQNLVPNPSFETYLFCPNGANAVVYATPWFSPTSATPDYFHSCALDPDFGVPTNFCGFQAAHTGEAYAGGFWLIANALYREYISAPLLEPLIAGHTYSVQFWVNITENFCGINQCGAYFSNADPNSNSSDLLMVTPQISYVGGFLNNYEDWVKIEGCFEAEGGEQFITIGNFTPTASSPLDPTCMQDVKAYYIVDDVIVVGLPDLEFNGPVLTCDDYLIDISIPDVEYIWSDGSTEPFLLVTQSGVYSVTISTNCDSENYTIEIIIHEPESVDIQPDELILCEGDLYEIHLEPAIYNYVWQDGANGPDYTISGPGVYQVTMDDGCQLSSDQIQVNINIPPEDEFLGDDIYLCSGESIEIEFDPELGNYVWQDSSTSYLYTIFNSGDYALTISNACGEFVDELTALPLYPPEVDLGPDTLLLCSGAPYQILLDPALGDFHWQDGSVLNSYLIQMPGIYAVTVTNECGASTASILVDNIPAFSGLDLGIDTSLCPGEQYVLSPGISGVSYVWQDLSTADTFMVLSPGTYYVQVVNACATASDTIEVAFNADPPDINFSSAISLCQGENLTLSAGISGVTYQWNDGSTADTLAINSPGNYSLMVSNSCGSDVDTFIVLDGGPAPHVALGNDVVLCVGENITLTPVYADVISWLWNDGSVLPTYTLTGNEIVTVEVSNSCGSSFDTLVASLLPVTPPLDLGADTSLCPGDHFLLIINDMDVNIEWSDGSVGSQFLINNPGNYFATISNTCGSNADTITITSLPGAPNLNLGNDQSFCPGETITVDPGIPNVTYLWQDGSTASTFNATQAVTIILIVSNECGAATDTLEMVESTQGPQVNLGPDILACEGDVVTLMSDISGVNYVWQDGSTGADYSTSLSGTFILEVSNNCGVDSDTIDVDIHGIPPSTELGDDTTLCTGSSLVLSSTFDIETNIEWYDGSSEHTLLVNGPGIYSLLETNHCGVHMDTINIDFLDEPISFDLGSDTLLCPGEFIILHAPITSSMIRWQDGSNNPAMVADKSQTYSLEISNACGIVNDELILAYDENIPEISLSTVTFICPGDQVELDVTQPFPANYLWNTGSILPVVIIEAPGNYSVSIQTLCAETAGETEAMVSDSCYAVNTFYIPNVFSPNGDKINDVFTINFNDEIEVHVIEAYIFDRWGNLVFYSETIPVEWKGDFKGESLNPGVYVYKIVMRYFDKVVERNVIVHGDVALVR